MSNEEKFALTGKTSACLKERKDLHSKSREKKVGYAGKIQLIIGLGYQLSLCMKQIL